MARVLERAANWLIKCGYISEFEIRLNKKTSEFEAVFRKTNQVRAYPKIDASIFEHEDELLAKYQKLPSEKQERLLQKAIEYCQESNPAFVEGYLRNEEKDGQAKSSYLAMILRSYLGRKNKRAEAA